MYNKVKQFLQRQVILKNLNLAKMVVLVQNLLNKKSLNFIKILLEESIYPEVWV